MGLVAHECKDSFDMGLFLGHVGRFGTGTGCSSSWLLMVDIHSLEYTRTLL